MIGARPNTGWLPAEALRDEGGFLRTGVDLTDAPEGPLDRAPFSLETSMPGVLAVGEGSIAVRHVHDLLAAEPRAREAKN
jgi:thioredoxin reductase (NADPH)